MKIKHPILLGFGLVVLYLLFWPSEKDHLNAQMAELCKKDGGVKIYETVKLPPEMFTSGGNPKETNFRNIQDYGYVSQIAENYELDTNVIEIKKGDPFKSEGRLERDYTKIVRISDKKLLAESVLYSRGGGDRWFAGMPSSAICPVNDGTNLLDKVFIKG